MKAGDDVLCVSEYGFFYEPYPKVNEICRIVATKYGYGKLFLRLEGYSYTITSHPNEGKIVGFAACNFRELISDLELQEALKELELEEAQLKLF